MSVFLKEWHNFRTFIVTYDLSQKYKISHSSHWHLASKYFASTKVASHMTQLTSPTSFWYNVKDLPKLLTSNFHLKTPSIFTRALTSNSCNWTSPNYHLWSSHGMCTQNFYHLWSISLFVYEQAPCQKWWRPSTNSWKINQIKPTHSPETLAVISKLK